MTASPASFTGVRFPRAHTAAESWLKERRERGQDGRDEVWEGEYRVAPNAPVEHALVAYEVKVVLSGRAREARLRGCDEFNLGSRDDFRVPDGGWLREDAARSLYMPTAEVVLEVLSPEDETFAKFPFYARHGVGELLVAHPVERWVRCWALRGQAYEEVDRSERLDVAMTTVVAEVRWP